MRSIRAIWLGTIVFGFVCGVMFTLVGAIALSLGSWIDYHVGFSVTAPSYVYRDRERTLWVECCTNSNDAFSGMCFPLLPFQFNQSFNRKVQPVLNSRIATPYIQAAALSLTFIVLVCTLIVIVRVSRRPEKWKPRTGQYTVLISGNFLWMIALAYFISLVLFFYSLAVENHRLDSQLVSARASWPQSIRSVTFYTLGTMLWLAVVSNILLLLSSLSFLLGSSLYAPPKIERTLTHSVVV
ncbi:hypothetical protein PHET_04512 [Paragonimus heterotremus]|uniref:Uncharacterized protein n=1 Tax=Paragonimus heterotremus TaxID=100268 RepID=A0A8J4WS60_9TREM|nr:hypothetical protein PHET_04512 [Paragonimus heterotremus]